MKRRESDTGWLLRIAAPAAMILVLVGCSGWIAEGQPEPARTAAATISATSATPAAALTQPTPDPTATRSRDEASPALTATPVATEPPPSMQTPGMAAAPLLAASATPIAAAAAPEGTAEPGRRPDLDALRLSLAPVLDGLSSPVFVTHAGDGRGRLFVVEKTGAVRILAGGRRLAEPFLNLADRITSSGYEQGLLGLAFPPDYAARGFFFVNYTDRRGDTIVSRFSVTADPNIADPASERQVLRIDQPAANHNGGMLAFGPDGMLWIGTGDGGGANDRYGNGQNPATLLGKMLRLDVTADPDQPYIVPSDNPWVSEKWDGVDVADEVWAIGLRNPWRYSFDRVTGDLWIADVGQNQIEEVNVVRAGSRGGLNFGWPVAEGDDCFQGAGCERSGLEEPVATYRHGADGCSVTGGYVYRGQRFPALVGTYLYADFCSGRIWGIDAAEPSQPVLLLESGSAISSFGEDEDGGLYVTDLGRGTVQQVLVE